MTKFGSKMKPQFKQMAFETAVRNPDRYLGVLSSLKSYEDRILDDDCILEIVSYLYLEGVVTSDDLIITKTSTIAEIKNDVIKVNSTRRADGGFPSGYASRFWTYMRTLSEFGFVYARYKEPFRFSEIAKKLISREIDEQEAFSIQAMKYNRKSPYRNVLNDYNFFRFALEVLIKLKEKNKSLSYDQFILLMFSRDGDVQDFIKFISNNKFKDAARVYEYLKNKLSVFNRLKTVVQDYPDVVRRVMIISGFITIRYDGIKTISINENKFDYISELLDIKFQISAEEKEDPKKYFARLDSSNDEYIALALKYRKKDELSGPDYTKKIFSIIALYELDETKVVESMRLIESNKSVIPEFQEIPNPLKLEFYIAILVALKYGSDFNVRPNYKVDHIGKPYSHAPGNFGDIDVYSSKIYWLIEVTLIRNKTQMLNSETTSVVRHLSADPEFIEYKDKYLSLIAPTIHSDTKDYFDVSLIQNKIAGARVSIKPYSIKEFIEITLKKENFKDMEKYSEQVFSSFRERLK